MFLLLTHFRSLVIYIKISRLMKTTQKKIRPIKKANLTVQKLLNELVQLPMPIKGKKLPESPQKIVLN